MKETTFITENKEKWARFERVYNSKVNEPEELSDLYMDITDDLSFAQTFYKRRTVRVYLNQLAQKVYTGVHKQKGQSLSNFVTIWKKSLPLEIYRSRKHLLFALIAFLIYTSIGVLTTHIDHDFPRTVLGDGYVNETLKNIKAGNPLAIYKDHDQMSMFIAITTNNLKVAFLTFFVGFFFTFGSHILMFYNGVMLGSFQYFFHLKGLLITSFLGIWIHGAFEISAIVLAAGAGITAGNGWLFPKSYTRIQSLQLSTKRGIKIMMSLVPFIIIAGFLESFVTAHYQELTNWSKWILILMSFGIILVFYVFYPLYIARKYPEEVDVEEVGFFPEKQKFVFEKIRTVGEIITDAFQFYKMYFAKFEKIIFIVIFPIIAVVVFLQDIQHFEELKREHYVDWISQFTYMIGSGFTSVQDVLTVFLWTLIFTLISGAVFWSIASIQEDFSFKSYFLFLKNRFLAIWVGIVFFLLIVVTVPLQYLFLPFFILPFFFLQGATMSLSDDSFKTRLKKSFRFSKNGYGNSLLIILFVLLFISLVSQPIAFVFSYHVGSQPMVRDLLDMMADFTKRIAANYTEFPVVWGNILRQLFYILFMLFLLPLLIIPSAFSYFSELEKAEAIGLKAQFKKFGQRSRLQEKEGDFE